MSDGETTPEWHSAEPAIVETPVPFAVFAASLKGGTDEVYSRLLKIRHGGLPRVPSDWRRLIAAARSEPAY